VSVTDVNVDSFFQAGAPNTAWTIAVTWLADGEPDSWALVVRQNNPAGPLVSDVGVGPGNLNAGNIDTFEGLDGSTVVVGVAPILSGIPGDYFYSPAFQLQN
jgi:hypothetical protein